MKKLISSILVLLMVVTSFQPVYANAGNNHVINSFSELELNFNEMSDKEKSIYYDVIQRDIEKYKNNDSSFDEKAFITQLNDVLLAMDESGTMILDRALIDFGIPNNVVATAVNLVISLMAGGVTTAAIRAYVLKKGANVAARELTKAVVSKLLAIGIKEVSGVGTIIRAVVNNLLDPGSAVANYLDRNDHKPRNGYVDVRAF